MDWMSILSSSVSGMLAPFAAIYALSAIGLNLHFGYTGLLNFGQIAFMMVGAFGVGAAVVNFGWPTWMGILLGIVGAVVLALLLGVPTLRLRGDYLAIATIASAEALRLFFNSKYLESVTNGPFGLGPASHGFTSLNPFKAGKQYEWGIFHFQGVHLWVMVVTWALVIIGCLFVFLLMRSPWGRVLKSVREDELAARSLGKNVYSVKLQSLVIGGVFGGLAGVMWIFSTDTVYPANFDPKITFYLWVIVILGGAGRILGPVLGALIFMLAFSFLGSFLGELFPGSDTGALRLSIVGLVLMLLMIFRPAGILGSREEMRLEVR